MAKNTTADKRLEGTKKYIDGLSADYSKLNIVRLDLSYKKPHSEEISLADANKDLEKMFNNMRSKPSVFKDKVGYVCKREYTKDKGVHFHTAFIYDGQKVNQSAFKADQIGEYWNQITEEKGSYHNCHRNEYRRNGLGILKHQDDEKRKIVDEDVISYLCKDDENQSVEAVAEGKKVKAFTRGLIPKAKEKMGRPRKESV